MTAINKTKIQARRLSAPQQQSTKTLAIMLMLLLCQFFVMSSAYSVQYPNGKHPMGSSVSHHHSHDSVLKAVHSHDAPKPTSFNATESIIDLVESSTALMTDTGEHDHNNHSHTPSHPPVEPRFDSEFYQAGTINDADVLYRNDRYAPPNPPPHS